MLGKKTVFIMCLLIGVSISGCLGSDDGQNVALWDCRLKETTDHIGEYTIGPYSYYMYEADAGYTYYIVEIKIVNNGSDEIEINAFDWKFQADGVSYDIDFATYSDYINYDSGRSVLPGGTITFELCYEVPDDTSNWSISYNGWHDLERDDSIL